MRQGSLQNKKGNLSSLIGRLKNIPVWKCPIIEDARCSAETCPVNYVHIKMMNIEKVLYERLKKNT